MDRIRVKKPHKILQISIVHNNKKPLELTEMKVWMVYSVSRVHKPLLLRLSKIATFPVCIFFPPFYFDFGWIQVSCYSSTGFNHKILFSSVKLLPWNHETAWLLWTHNLGKTNFQKLIQIFSVTCWKVTPKFKVSEETFWFRQNQIGFCCLSCHREMFTSSNCACMSPLDHKLERFLQKIRLFLHC